MKVYVEMSDTEFEKYKEFLEKSKSGLFKEDILYLATQLYDEIEKAGGIISSKLSFDSKMGKIKTDKAIITVAIEGI